MGNFYDEPDPGPPAWCLVCDGISGSRFFLWTNDHRYVCPECWKRINPDPIMLLGPFEQVIEHDGRLISAAYLIPPLQLAKWPSYPVV